MSGANFADRIISDKSNTCVPNHIKSLIDKIPERNKDKYMEEIDKNIIIHEIDSDRAGIKKMVIGIADSSLKRLNINIEDMIKEFKKMGLLLSTPSTPYLQEGYSCYEIWLPKNSAEPNFIKDRRDENDIPPADREVQKNENEISLAGLDIRTIGLEERKNEDDIPTEGLDIPTVGLEERKNEKDIPQAGLDIPTIGLAERKNEKDIPPEGLEERKNEDDIPTEGLDIPTVGIEERKNEKDIPQAGLDIPTTGLAERKNEKDIPPEGLEERKNEKDIPQTGLDIPIEGLEERENENDIPTAGFEERKNEINLPPSSHGEQSKINRYEITSSGKKNGMFA